MKVVFVEFEAVAPGIFCVETADLWERGVVGDFDAASEQGVPQFVKVSGNEGGMGFLGGAEKQTQIARMLIDFACVVALADPLEANGSTRLLWTASCLEIA